MGAGVVAILFRAFRPFRGSIPRCPKIVAEFGHLIGYGGARDFAHFPSYVPTIRPSNDAR